MGKSIADVSKAFTALADRIEKTWAPHYARNSTLKKTIGWQAPALTPADAINLSQIIAGRFLELADDGDSPQIEIDEYYESFADQANELDFVNLTQDPLNVIRSTFEFLLFVANELPTQAATVDWDKVKDADLVPKQISRRLKAIEARLSSLEPRAEVVGEKISVIEAAHDAAERLPTDLEELRRASDEISNLQIEASRADFRIGEYLKSTAEHSRSVEALQKEAAALVEKCEAAYRITTSAGLAGAFEHRSRSLAWVGWAWVVILIVSLISAVWLGKDRYDGLNALLVGDHPNSLVYLNILFAILGVAAPVWLAWLATRSIGQSFRLSEDYAFKASVSKAYEGYRKEAISLDPEFAKRLFGSALTRLDEAPSRFIVSEDHNTPLQDLLDNEAFKKIIETFPEVREKVGDFIVNSKEAVSGAVAGLATATKTKMSAKAKSDAKEGDPE